jgi:hypothetical protein
MQDTPCVKGSVVCVRIIYKHLHNDKIMVHFMSSQVFNDKNFHVYL